MPFRSFSRPHPRDPLPPCSLRALAVYGGDTVRGRNFKTPYVPDVALHVFEVGECRDRPNVLGFQAIADRLPGQLSEDGHCELVSLGSGSPDAAFCWRRALGLGFVKAFWNSGSACMNLILAKFVRAACGMSSRLASPRLIFRSRDFRAESWPGLKDLCFSGFLATPSRAEQPQQQTWCESHSAPMAALARRLAQAARIASERGVAGRFSFSGFSVVVEVIPPLKNAKVFRHKITWGAL